MTKKRETDYTIPAKPRPEPHEFVLPDPRCKECDYWKHLGGISNYGIRCCHYALEKGELRKRVSETECASFIDRATAPKRTISYNSVPMSQWGLGGLGCVRKEQR